MLAYYILTAGLTDFGTWSQPRSTHRGYTIHMSNFGNPRQFCMGLMHQSQDDDLYLSPCSRELFLLTVRSLSKKFAPTSRNIMREVPRCRSRNDWGWRVQNYVDLGTLANSQLLAAAVASWTITKSKMAIQWNTAIQWNMAIQANPHEQLAMEGMLNRAVSVTSWHRPVTSRPVPNSLGLVLFQKY